MKAPTPLVWDRTVPAFKRRLRSRGFTIVELMVSIAIALIVLSGLVALFANSSVARLEIDKTSRQIESGRFAMQVLSDEIRHAGYFGALTAAPSIPASVPDPCDTTTATAQAGVGLPIQGYAGASTASMATTLTCLDSASGYVANTAVLVVRRASTTGSSATPTTGYFNIQVSGCSGDTASYIVDATSSASYTLHAKSSTVSCSPLTSAPSALITPIYTRIFYIAGCSNKSDCTASGADSVPTLKRIDVGPGARTTTAIVDGIENVQFEYGQDTDGDGAPNSYTNATTGVPATVAGWANVVSVRVHLLARNIDATGGYTDAKTYALGSGVSVTPAGSYRRRAYDEVTRINNVAGRLE